MPAGQSRRIVYFLGAGASLGAGAYAAVQGGGRVPIPTQDSFWETFLRFCTTSNKRDIERFLFRYFLGYARAPARTSSANRRKQLRPIDVEEVFTFLSERNNAPEISNQFQAYTGRVWDALLEEVGSVFGRFRANAQTKKVFREFKRNHLRSRDTVVSFNYDVVFEQSLPANFGWYYGAVDSTHRAQSLRVLKPHGSINWEEHKGAIRARRSVFPAQPIIVAPTHLKFVGKGRNLDDSLQPIVGYLNQAKQVPKIWSAMEIEMRAAKGWVFVGYSFPSSDLYFSSIMRSTLAVRSAFPFIAIVNPDSLNISRRLQDRFAIPKDRIRTFSDFQLFNQVTRQQLLNMF